jgi:hypothetical protein
MTVSRHIPVEDLVAYLLQENSQDEAASLRAHLSECASCQAELTRVSGDLSLFAMSVKPEPLPEGARQRFLSRIAADTSRPLEPLATQATRTTRLAPRRWAVTWVPWGAVAAMLLVTAALGVKLHFANLALDRQLALAAAQSAENAQARRVFELLTARASQRIFLAAAGTHPAPSARAIYLASRGTLILQASNLNPLPNGKTYELWIIPADGSSPVPAGLFHPDAAGNSNVVLPQIPEGVQAKAFGVTVENDGGSATPTPPIVLSGAAPASGE